MKLTEEHHKFAAKQANLHTSSQSWSCEADEGEAYAAIQAGVRAAIEEFGGIPWNKYPDTKPASPGRYLVLLKPEYSLFEYERNSDILYTGPEIDEWDGTGISVTLWQGVLWWAEINLPNK